MTCGPVLPGLREVWEDGQAFQDIVQRQALICKQRETIEAARKVYTLTKRCAIIHDTSRCWLRTAKTRQVPCHDRLNTLNTGKDSCISTPH